MNRGNYRYPIIIKEKQALETTNELGEPDTGYVQVKRLFANIETRIGGLLSGRPADTIMTTVTHKITYPYKNYPNLRPDKHIIFYGTKRFDINYTLDDGFKHEEMQVFVTLKEY